MKTITLKIKLPEWAEWLAQSLDGEVWVFSHKPCTQGQVWFSHVAQESSVCKGVPNENWKETLQRIK